MKPGEVYTELKQVSQHVHAPAIREVPARLADLHSRCEQLLDTYHPERNLHLDCQSGCGDCCILNVAVLWPEALNILAFIEAGSFDLAVLEERLDALWTQVRGVDDEDRVCMRKPCAFLSVQGSCEIYPVRPLLCRSITSTDADACRDSFNAYLYNEKRAVEMNLFQKELYDAAYLGLSRGLEELGLDGRGFELSGLLRYLIKDASRRSAFGQGRRLDWQDLS